MDHHTSRVRTWPSIPKTPLIPTTGLRRIFTQGLTMAVFALALLTLAPGAAHAQDDLSGVTILGGDGQRGAVGDLLGRSFRVRVVNEDGVPIAGAAVQWNLVFGEAQLLSGGVTTSDANGEARNRLRLGNRVGLVQVAVRAAGADGSEIFTVKV
ncbi:MAG: hypothetical protein AAFY88_31085, partial [Acidobacteriota bacterium]